MNTKQKRNLLSIQLKENVALLDKSIDALMYSYEKCKPISNRTDYNAEEQESFEAMTSRYARSSDILTQKVFKTFFSLLQENIRTIIDAANLLEKLDIVETADMILDIRELRNQIAHEYLTTDLDSLFKDVLRAVPELLMVIKTFKKYLALHPIHP